MISLTGLKKIIQEEIKFYMKNGLISEGKLLTENDNEPKIYKISSNDRTINILVAVIGDKIYKTEGEFPNYKATNEVIGGGKVSDFVDGVKAYGANFAKQGIYKGETLIDANKINKFFANPTNVEIAYGFVLRDGIPNLVGYTANKRNYDGMPIALFNFDAKTFDTDSPLPIEKKTSEIPRSSTTINEIPDIAELNADFKYDSDGLNNDGEFTKQLTDYLNEFAKPEFQYLKKYEPLPLMVAASASIDTLNAKYDYRLTIDRVNAISRKIEEISKTNPKIPKFKIEPMPLGQTDRFAKGIKYPEVKDTKKTAVNRKVIVGLAPKVKTFLAKYPAEINKG